MAVPSEVLEALEHLRSNGNFDIVYNWLKSSRDTALKTFSAPLPADQMPIHFHVQGRYSVLNEIVAAIELAKRRK